MNRARWLSCTFAVLALAGCGDSRDVPAPAMQALENAEQYVLLSLDPTPPAAPGIEQFHGFGVLGQTTVADASTRKRLNDALRRGARESDGMVAACFNPRHGIRATRAGKTTDLVICFECRSVAAYEGDQKRDGFLVTPSPQDTFDDVLARAGIARATSAAK